jgi:chromosome segregation ATPase
MRLHRSLRLLLAGATLTTASFAIDSELAALVAKAEKGNAIAQYNVGLAYAEGRGVEVDRVAAFYWLSLAQQNGARGKALDDLTPKLSADELAAARARLAAVGAAPAETNTAPAPAAASRELSQALADKQQLSAELAAAWKEVEQLKSQLAQAQSAPVASADLTQLTRERDSLSTKLTDLAGDVATLRAERERLQKLAAQVQKDVADAREVSRAREEQARIADMRAAQLTRETEQLKAELTQRATAPVAYPDLRERVQDLEAQVAALRQAPPAFPDLRGRVNELEQQLAAATASKPALPPDYPDLRVRVAQLEKELTAAAELSRSATAELTAAATAKKFAEAELTTLRSQLAAARDAAASAPAFPDLRGRVQELESQLAAARNAAPAYPDLGDRVRQLESALATARAQIERATATVAPAFPDLRDRVRELETALAAAQSAAPAYPDLRPRVAELEKQLAATPLSVPVATPDEALTAKLAETEGKLATALRGFSLLQKDTDELRARLEQSTRSLSSDRDALAAKLAAAEETTRVAQAEVATLNDSLNSLQRGSSQTGIELAAARALIAQLQGTNTVLARENYDLKAQLAPAPTRGTLSSSTAPAESTPTRTHVVAAGDSLTKISARYYGTPDRWSDLVAANRDTLDAKATLRIGMTLRVP